MSNNCPIFNSFPKLANQRKNKQTYANVPSSSRRRFKRLVRTWRLKSWPLPQLIPSGNRSLSDLLNLPTKKWVAFHSYVNSQRVTHRRLNHPNPSIWGKLSDIATPNDIKKNRTYSNYYNTLSNFPCIFLGDTTIITAHK